MYENFKSQLVGRLTDHLSTTDLSFVLDQLDVVMYQYDLIEKERGVVLYENGIPEIVKTFIACKKVQGMSKGSLENYYLIMSKFFQFIQKPLDKINTNDVRVFLFKYQEMKNISNRTLDQYQTIIKTFFTWCCDEGYLERDVARKLKPVKYEEKQREALSQLELEVLRNVCETSRDRAMVEFMYSTGCRVSEFCNIKLNDIDWNEKKVVLFGKGSKYRTSYLNDKSIYYLKEYLKDRKGDSQYVFVSERAPYKQIKKDGVDKRFRYLNNKANVGKNITPHVLRHTTATVGLQNGMPVTDIQKLLGHSNLDTTMIYAKTSQFEVQNNHRKYVV